MKSSKPVGIIFGILLFLFVFIVLYDKYLGGDDGFIKGFAFKRIFGQIVILFSLFWLLGMGISTKSKVLQNISLSFLSLVSCFLIFELFSFFVFRTGIIKGDTPRHHLNTDAARLSADRRPFWGDYNPHFAKWYLPLDTLKRKNCSGDSLVSFTNSFGARDRERTLTASSGRVALLGDSFIEGYMVNAGERLSNRLEEASGIEHLNFGINGTSPINYYLTYKHLAKKFDHDVLIVGILPANDFEDFTKEKLSSLVENPMYRPYWHGSYPNYKLRYSLASINHSSHSLFHYENPEKINAAIDSAFTAMSWTDRTKAVLKDNMYTWHFVEWARQRIASAAPPEFSRFNSYSRDEWNIFSFSLEQLLKEANGKNVIFLLLPTLNDVRAYDHNRHSRLAEDLNRTIGKRPNVGIIDLLPVFHAQKGRWEDFYVVCDGHWSAEGERFASSVLLNHPLYKAALSGLRIK